MYTSSQSTLSRLSNDVHVAYVIFCFDEETSFQNVLQKANILGAAFSLPLAFPFPSPSQGDGLGSSS